MRHSRDIAELRADVAANCREFLARCEAAGLRVLVTETTRDREYQEYCYAIGTAQSKVPSFHAEGAGLAFDICQNIKGHEYDDPAFFTRCALIAEEIGFEWGGRWQSFRDLPHFQWSGASHEYNSRDIIAGRLPPAMPQAKEEQPLTQAEFDKMLETYLLKRAQNAPAAWSAEAREWAEKNGILQGGEGGQKAYDAFCTREQIAALLKRLYDKFLAK